MTSNAATATATTTTTASTGKQLDAYSIMIVSKYFQNVQDFANLEKSCKKYRGNSALFHYNPIEFPNEDALKKIFPNVETRHVYSPYTVVPNPLDNYHAIVYWRYANAVEAPNDPQELAKTKFNSFVLDRHRHEFGAHWTCIKKKVRVDPALTEYRDYNCHFSVDNWCLRMPARLARLERALTPLYGNVLTPIQCDLIRTIDIRKSYIEHIPQGCFAHCLQLTKFVFPKNLLTVGRDAFFGCPLTEVSFNVESLIVFQQGAFHFINNKIHEVYLYDESNPGRNIGQMIANGDRCTKSIINALSTLGDNDNGFAFFVKAGQNPRPITVVSLYRPPHN